MAQGPIVETNSITRRFEDLVAVDHVTFSVEEGSVFGLVGLNGAGKTTLIKMLITLLPPSEGSAKICGFDVQQNPSQVRQVIGYVPQLVSADGDLTAYENLLVYAKLYDVPARERRDRIFESLEFMNLDSVAKKVVKQFSGGMVRRLEIAQSMIHRPRLLFLDEPTVGLDPLARASVWEHILALRSKYETTIFLTTHLLDEVEELCTRLAIMSTGHMVAMGTIDELKTRAGSEEIEDVFVHFAGDAEQEGGYRAAKAARRAAKRLG